MYTKSIFNYLRNTIQQNTKNLHVKNNFEEFFHPKKMNELHCLTLSQLLMRFYF